MSKGRLEAFSDGVIAIIITIMVLELKVPEGVGLEALHQIAPVLLSYLLSFVFVGIYWNNHHHLFQAVQRVDGTVLWANLHLLFWLSLVPFATKWIGEHPLTPWPLAAYGVVLWCSGLAYYILERRLQAQHDENSVLNAAIGVDVKGLLSLVLYTLAIPCAFLSPAFAIVLFVAVAVMWFVPDRRIEESMKG